MKNFSFRFKITLSLTFLIIITIYVSFSILNKNITETIEENFHENIKTSLTFMQQNCFEIKEKHDVEIFYTLLQSLSESHNILNAAFINESGITTFSSDPDYLKVHSAMLLPEFSEDELISIVPVHSDATRAFLKLKACKNHIPPNKGVCGYIVVDYNKHELTESLGLITNFGRILTVFLLLTIFSVMLVMHYRYVRGSLNKFKNTISYIEKGSLDTRVQISQSDELGDLAASFNGMLDKLQEMQTEITGYHQRELSNSKKMATLGEMASVVAHEIKNPLTGIGNAIEIVVAEMANTKRKPVLQEIQRQVGRVNGTINALLQFSRPLDLQRSRGDINKIVEQTVFFFENQLTDKIINFDLRLANNIPHFDFDPKQIEAVLINLIQNSVQAIKNKGEIEISSIWKVERKEVIISIKDSGSGITEENMDKILKPFFTTRNKGTGLGLSISKNIIEKHNGSLEIRSHVDKGTIILLIFPVEEEYKVSFNGEHIHEA